MPLTLSDAALLRMIDGLTTAIWLLDVTGAEVHRNPRARDLLHEEAESDRLVLQAGDLARSLARLRAGSQNGQSAGPLSPGERIIAVGGARYRLRALYLEPGLLDAAGGVLIEIDLLTPRLPSRRALQDAFGLTPRQSDVALLLAKGKSNREIAAALSISAHTVRSHAEKVFQKLDIHTRKALALRLMFAPSRAVSLIHDS